MASSGSGKRKTAGTSSGRKQSNTGKRGSSKTSGAQSRKRKSEPLEDSVRTELWLVVFTAACCLLFLCNFGIIGVFGNTLRGIMFGIFGFAQYVLPLAAVIFMLFRIFNRENSVVTRKLVAAGVLVLLFMVICDLFTNSIDSKLPLSLKDIYTRCSQDLKGGGVLGGIPAYLLVKYLSYAGTWVLLIVLVIICIMLITGRSLFDGVREQGQIMYDESVEDRRARKLERDELRRERNEKKAEKTARQREINDAREEEKRLRSEAKENDELLFGKGKKVRGVTHNTTLVSMPDTSDAEAEVSHDDEHRIKVVDREVYENTLDTSAVRHERITSEGSDATREITVSGLSDTYDEHDIYVRPETEPGAVEIQNVVQTYPEQEEGVTEALSPRDSYTTEYGNTLERSSDAVRPSAKLKKETPEFPGDKSATAAAPKSRAAANTSDSMPADLTPSPKSSYKFPPIALLSEGSKGSRSSADSELRSTSERLQSTLETFGVHAKITDVSRGPAVTRYELQPELGVKVSKIVGLQDDLKLALAATDIRIEAPIPGKSAVGIEVPNKVNEAVAFRDLIESTEFQKSNASLPFAVGKDIGGKIIIHDIAKMPHVLIAGATGSGKSVCINTIIMSILYKCRPEDVRLMLIDPKVVELSVYNTIPHLLYPVVTDAKKASGALAWAVHEMTDRYAKFADKGVRDLKGYNDSLEDTETKLPHILIIVDELADLMMVAPGEVEESICRLAQLARACGIHLVIATQRPSVDVITGLIKANMPSRIAFAVSSGVDSRTILDMVGAEKLLGKGDMLFYPQGLPKPIRVQGAFVPDKDVTKVSGFFKDLQYVAGGTEEVRNQMNAAVENTSGSGNDAGRDGDSQYDELFAKAGAFIIDKEKASIGALQRLLKIGFNRAARIMDQLCEAGVVGEEQGTKPREILMNAEQFDELLESLGLK